jgi:hypothetical protein
MIDNNSLNDRVISLSLLKSELQQAVFDPIYHLDLIDIHIRFLHFELEVLLMSGVLASGLLDDVHVFYHWGLANFDVEHPLAWLLEVHLNRRWRTSANFKIRVCLPVLTGRL